MGHENDFVVEDKRGSGGNPQAGELSRERSNVVGLETKRTSPRQKGDVHKGKPAYAGYVRLGES